MQFDLNRTDFLNICFAAETPTPDAIDLPAVLANVDLISVADHHGSPMSAAQGTTVHEKLLHPHLGQCSSTAPAVCWLPSATCAATPSFGVRSSGPCCGRPGGLELVTILSSRPDAFCGQFLSRLATSKLFFSRFTSVHSALGAFFNASCALRLKATAVAVRRLL